VVVLALSAPQVGITPEIWDEGLVLSATDLAVVPQAVVEDATRLAQELFGNYQDKYNSFMNQLLATYLEAEEKDFVIVFNPGGWGEELVEASPDWQSISSGIESELESSGYSSLLLTYRRTVDTLQSRFRELVELVTGYSLKAEELAYRIEFLTSHIPELRVIITGESNGTIISDQVMRILASNQQVYSIEIGPPFWYKKAMLDRTLVISNNGIVPDAFSRGNILAMIRANLGGLFGHPAADSGNILYFIRAPGHDYQWQYPEVSAQIRDFLEGLTKNPKAATEQTK
jgi:hypothetical protein